MLFKQTNNLKDRIKHLMSSNCPNLAIIDGILEGKVKGEVWMNANETACLLTSSSPFNFIAGDISEDFIKETLALIYHPHAFLVHCSDANFFLNKTYPLQKRVQYSCYASEIINAPEKIEEKIRRKYVLKHIDCDLFNKCFWRSRLLEFYQSSDNFLNFGYGTLLLEEQTVVAELYGIVGGDFLEIGAYAHEGYRSAGLMTFMVADSLKYYCLDKNLTITASCDVTNVACEKSMPRSGLKKEFEYSVLDVAKWRQEIGETIHSSHIPSEENILI